MKEPLYFLICFTKKSRGTRAPLQSQGRACAFVNKDNQQAGLVLDEETKQNERNDTLSLFCFCTIIQPYLDDLAKGKEGNDYLFTTATKGTLIAPKTFTNEVNSI